MSKDTAQRLHRAAARLNENLFSDTFDEVMLQELSSLLKPAHIASVYRTNGSEGEIRVCEFRGREYHDEATTAKGFAERFGLAFQDALASPPGEIKVAPAGMHRIIIPFSLTRFDCVIVAEAPENPRLPDDLPSRISSILGLLLHARHSVKDAMKGMDLENERFAGARHRIQGVISSITTAVQMLSSSELSNEEEEEIRGLARRGVGELTGLIEGITGKGR